MPNDVQISKFMSLVLRHAPDEARLTLDANGWADFQTLSSAVVERSGVTEADVRRVIEENPKQRFVVEGSRIRAAEGHSVVVDLSLKPTPPPKFLFHGTKAAFLPSIMAEGLVKGARHHVHLSPDPATARIVAARRKGDSAILKVAAGEMARKGMAFFLSENGVWLTDHVPPLFISRMDEGAAG